MLQKDADRFYEILTPFLDWAHKLEDVKSILKDALADGNPADVPMKMESLTLSFIWQHPERIDQYLAEKGTEIPDQARQMLADWRENYAIGPFFVERATNTGAIFISAATGKVYLVRGITNKIFTMLPPTILPCLVNTSLVPYNGCIVYDSTLQLVPDIWDRLDGNAQQLVHQIYDIAKRYNNIIRRLPPKQDATTDKQQDLMIEVMMPLMMKESSTVDADTFNRQAAENPNLHLIPDKDLSILDDLLDKDFRNQKDWDKIQEILNSGDIFSAVPIGQPKIVKEIEGILSYKGDLMAFTTLEKCQQFLKHLSDMDDSLRYTKIVSGSLEYMIDIANRRHCKLLVDFPFGNPFKKCILYESESNRITASIVLHL